MKRSLALALLLCLCLCGCRGPFALSLPRAKEPGKTAIASVLGLAEAQTEGLSFFAATQKRGSDGALLYESHGDSISGALNNCRNQGEETLSFSHVEHLILDADAQVGRLSQLVRFSLQNGEQSAQSCLWVLRDGDMEELFSQQEDLTGRLNTLHVGSKTGSALPTRTLQEVALAQNDSGATLIPALRQGEDGLIFDSYALFQEDILLGFVDGEGARAAAVLWGETLYWSEVLDTNKGRAVVQLRSNGVKVTPQLQEKELKSLAIKCEVEAILVESPPGVVGTQLQDLVKVQVEDGLARGLRQLQSYGVDGGSLLRKAGMGNPLRWASVKEQWAQRYPNLPFTLTVSLRMNDES